MTASRCNILALTGTEMAAAYRNGSVSPVEVVAASLEAADAASTLYNAIASINEVDATAAALRSEQRFRRGEPYGPLDGVPITFKDSFHVRGLPRWHGTAMNAGTVSAGDAAPVSRCREAGMVVVAKTTMPDYAMLMSGLSSQHGVIRNAWDRSTNPGGSSAGAGPAVAAGVAPIAVGTDMVGSVRLPAALSGLASIKPTQGRIAYDPPGNYRSAGPMAKTVDDVEHALEVLGVDDARDHFALEGRYLALPDTLDWLDRRQALRGLRGLRVGVLASLGFGATVDDVTATAVTSQAATLKQLGATVSTIADLDVNAADYESIYWFMIHKGIAEYYLAEPEQRARILPEVGAMLDEALDQSAMFVAVQNRRMALATEAVRRQLEPFDVILSPALPVHAFSATSVAPGGAAAPMSHMGFACWFNQLGWPAGTVPVQPGIAGGPPVSVQLAGKRFDDARILQVMRLLERERGFTPVYPTLTLPTPSPAAPTPSLTL